MWRKFLLFSDGFSANIEKILRTSKMFAIDYQRNTDICVYVE